MKKIPLKLKVNKLIKWKIMLLLYYNMVENKNGGLKIGTQISGIIKSWKYF